MIFYKRNGRFLGYYGCPINVNHLSIGCFFVLGKSIFFCINKVRNSVSQWKQNFTKHNKAKQMKKKICIFGDSIVRGTGDPTWGGRATRLRVKIESVQESIQVFPLGVSGNTTKDLLQRFSTEATARHPSLIIISWGINDSKIYSENKKELVPRDEFIATYRELLTQAKTFTDQIICIWPTSVDESRTLPYRTASGNWYDFTNQRITQYDRAIQEIAQEQNCTYLSVQKLLKSEDLGDGLHPNTQWHIKLYHYMRDYFEPYLKEREWFTENGFL